MTDAVTSAAVSFLVGRTRRKLARGEGASEVDFAKLMSSRPIAVRPDAANAQHYELNAEFFALVLGPRRKYSCCLYQTPRDTLAVAEERALAETAAHAALADGQDILELGCGWGSLSLWMAEQYPAARITAVSNSHGQRRAYRSAGARSAGFRNLRVVTADMNDFTIDQTIRPHRFGGDVRAHDQLAVAAWPRARLAASGRAAFHPRVQPPLGAVSVRHRGQGGLDRPTFLHRRDHAKPRADPACGGHVRGRGRLALERTPLCPDRTGLAGQLRPQRDRGDRTVLRDVYGADAALWKRRWRLFFLATAGLFGHAGGAEWGVSHYRLRPLAQ